MSAFTGLLGGKGGFGSLLRSIKAKSKPTDNFDACRDLESGRRMGQVTQQTRLREWQQKKKEEDEYVNKEMEKYKKERAQNMGQSGIHRKLDNKFIQIMEESSSSIKDAVKQGFELNLQKSENTTPKKQGGKRTFQQRLTSEDDL